MTSTAPQEELSVPGSVVSRSIAMARVVVGLLQGILLYLLYIALQHKVWPATDGHFFAPLLLVSAFVPILFISGLGHANMRRFMLWIVAASVIAWLVGFYDVWRLSPLHEDQYGVIRDTKGILPSFMAIFFTGVGLCIAHALVLAATVDRRWIARYPTYFEVAWKLAIQIKLSVLFVGVLWLVLWLGASLFMLLNLDFLNILLQKPWFSIPITAFAFSSALHITDVRPGIVRGIRTLLLVLMSWLLPLATLIVLGFVLSLPGTGLAPLWATRHATAVLLGAAAVLVLLINTAFQNGEFASQVSPLLRWSARFAAVLLAPIVLIGIYALGLRVADYGWTTDRVIAAACLLVASCYAGGYVWAAIARGAWLRRLAAVNVATAFLVLAVLLAIFLPIADPARISVANQSARLEMGRVSVAKFDFDYLRFHGERYGWDVLQKLKVTTQGSDATLIREKAEKSLVKRNRWEQEKPVATLSEIVKNFNVWPKGATLPQSLLNQNWGLSKHQWSVPECLKFLGQKCDAYLMDFTGDGKPEVLFISHGDYPRTAIVMENTEGVWDEVGRLAAFSPSCRQEIQKSLATGSYRLVPPLLQDMEIAGRHIHIDRNEETNRECLQ